MLFALNSCEKAEKLYPEPTIPKGIQTQIFGMGENYENQIWFEFSTQATAINRSDVWDIAFSCGAENTIKINGGKNSYFGVARFPGADFNSFTAIDVKQTMWEFDNPGGLSDSMVFNGWCSAAGAGTYKSNDVLYIIDLGEDTLTSKRYIKLKLDGRYPGYYKFSWAYMGDTAARSTVTLNTNTDYNYVYYSFGAKAEVQNEPFTNTKWDIVFTTYKQIIPDENSKPFPYILRGVLSNQNGVEVGEIKNIPFEDINISNALAAVYSQKQDEIGYDWKIWNLTANKYTVDQNKIYLIKDTKGQYFKMKFVDFYDDQGRKGYPKMAWELLK